MNYCQYVLKYYASNIDKPHEFCDRPTSQRSHGYWLCDEHIAQVEQNRGTLPVEIDGEPYITDIGRMYVRIT